MRVVAVGRGAPISLEVGAPLASSAVRAVVPMGDGGEFIDSARIYVRAGDGGDGAVHFRREKYVPEGGPDGGDGGKGGDVLAVVDPNLSTLYDFSSRPHWKAGRGRPGGGARRTGAAGDDVVLRVPPGTVVIDDEAGDVLADLVEPGQKVAFARGGRGGRGNARFSTSTRRAPKFAENGERGESFRLRLELKVLADVGLAGFPNAGKSTLLSRVSKARPKVAAYPFTTLVPELGVVSLGDGASFVMADIPGLIEGAHEGTGLGHAFLRHLERTALLVHVVDCSGFEGRDPLESFDQINRELLLYREELVARPQLVAANKIDLPEGRVAAEKLREALGARGHEVFLISAVTGEGVDSLLARAWERLRTLRADEGARIDPDESDAMRRGDQIDRQSRDDRVVEYGPSAGDRTAGGRATPPYVGPGRREATGRVREYRVYRDPASAALVVEGAGLTRVMARMDVENPEAVRYLLGLLADIGVDEALRRHGVEEGDTVRVGELEFEYVE